MYRSSNPYIDVPITPTGHRTGRLGSPNPYSRSRKRTSYKKKSYGKKSYRKSYRKYPSRKYSSKSASTPHLVKIYDKAEQIFATGSVNSGSYGVRRSDRFTHKFTSRPAIYGVTKSGTYFLPSGAIVLKGTKRLFKTYGPSGVTAASGNPGSTSAKKAFMKRISGGKTLSAKQRQAGANFIVAFKGLMRQGKGQRKACDLAHKWALQSTGLKASQFPKPKLAHPTSKSVYRRFGNPGSRRHPGLEGRPGRLRRMFHGFKKGSTTRRHLGKIVRRVRRGTPKGQIRRFTKRMHGVNLPASRKWIQRAHIKKGALRMQLKRLGKLKGDGPIPVKVLQWAKKQSAKKHPHLARRAQLALKLRKYR